uniref:Mediator of RNA polymerase II transcription subunit 31 n=1 Tax=Fibrocapsa japonica TaxID=94617 RepID=A0A7S2UT54_9STRA|mmetsp:Transcript_12131/g.17900  ORF Transcript_12131/g.17900 Transcript_12131/m.17900 type:complete len:140 (+) Transcript_12131:72-491(+)
MNTNESDDEDISNVISGKDRFEVELEFVQSLANPEYLHYLAQNRFLSNPAFLRFLKYLQYWKEPPYCKFIVYPNSLAYLDLLIESEQFRKELAVVQFRDFVHQQQFHHWQHHMNNCHAKMGLEDASQQMEDSESEKEDG